jgi:TonB family protein
MPAGAQTGPLEPRIVFVAMPTPLPKPAKNESLRVPVNLDIGADGRATKVELLGTSGNDKFDEKVRNYYARFRFIPALDDNGAPIPSTYKFIYKYQINEQDPPPAPPTLPPPASATVGEPGVSNARVFDEVDRVTRMHCKDFLWEYDLMKEIAGARPLYNERMLRTSLAMFIVQMNVKGDELGTLNNAFSSGVREAVDECRKRPDAKYFLDVLSPALKTRLRR